MRIETEIARENIKFYNKEIARLVKGNLRFTLKAHKQTCQRFLEFLLDVDAYLGKYLLKYPSSEEKFWDKEINIPDENIEEKITDLKQAIKLYEEDGI